MRWTLHTAPGAPRPALEDGFPAGRQGASFVRRRTVTVRRIDLPDGRRGVVKRYCFPSWRGRLAGALRHSLLGTPKPVQEARSLLRLRSAGVPAVAAWAWAVARSGPGFVADGWLLTGYQEAVNLDSLLRAGRAPGDPAFWEGLGASVGRIHAAGCWYRNLRPRNLLVAGDGAFFWLDPSKSRWQAGEVHAAHALDDLLGMLAPVEDRLPSGAFRAFLQGHARWPGVQTMGELWGLLPAVARPPVQARVLRERSRLPALPPGGPDASPG